LKLYTDNLEFAQNMKNSPVYVANQEMDNLMKDAYYQLESAKSAVMNDKLDDARGILRYEVGENYKYPRPVREAAEDARYMIKRGEGIDWREQGYESIDEAKEDLLNKIQEAQKQNIKKIIGRMLQIRLKVNLKKFNTMIFIQTYLRIQETQLQILQI